MTGAQTELPTEDASKARRDIFIAFAEDDRAWVEGFLLNVLRAAGVSYFDESQFDLGRPSSTQFVEAVERSDRVLLVVSPAFLLDSGGERVKLLAEQFGREHRTWPVIPLLLKPVPKLPLELSMLTLLDATDPAHWEDRLGRLVTQLTSRPSQAQAPPRCPYPGLASFTVEMADAFYGREAEIAEVQRLIRADPVLAVVGTSGSGKSSLLDAGVSPRLAREGFTVVTMRPGPDPTGRLLNAVDAPPDHASRPVLLVVDQLEELFTLAPKGPPGREHVDAFCEQLVRRWSSGWIRCILAIRADYYPQLMTSPLWPHVRGHRLELLPLTGRELRLAITEPATSVDVHVESALVERLVSDAAGEPGSLPLVQETLVMLWDHVLRRYLPMSAYDALILTRRSYGEPPRTALQVALARHADATINALDEQERLIARRILLRLVQLMDGRDDVRRQQRRRELQTRDTSPEVFDKVLQHLVRSRLVTSTADDKTTDPNEALVDLAHEAIITTWPQLREWIVDRRSAELFRRRLEGSAAEWTRLGKGSGGLLDGVELLEAERWLAGPDGGELGISEPVADLVKESRATLEAARQRKKRVDRLFRLLTAGLAVLLVAVVIVAILAVQKRNEAEEARAVSRSGELGLAATGLPPEQVDRALLLAEEGLALRRTPLTIGGALAALTSNPRVQQLIHPPSPQYAVAATADGKTAVTGGLDGVVRLWQPVGQGSSTSLSQMRGEIRSVALSPDGHRAAATSSGGDIRQWALPSGAVIGSPAGPAASGSPAATHVGSVRAVAYSPDGTLLATAGEDGVAVLQDARSGRVRHTLRGYKDWLNAVAFTPDGRLLAVAGGRTEGRSVDRRILLFDVATGDLRMQLPGHPDAVRSLAMRPDGSMLASAGAEGALKLWSLPDGHIVRELTGHSGRIFAAAFSPDGAVLVTAGRDRTIRVWDVTTGKAQGEPLRGHTGSVRGIAFTGPRQILSVGNDYRMAIWDVSPQAPSRLASFLPDEERVTRALAVDLPGGRMATGDDSGEVVVRQTSDGSPTGVRIPLDGPVSAVAFGPGAMLVTATYTGTVRVWDAATGEPRSDGVDLGEGSLVLAVSGDGRLIATGGDTNVIRLWDATMHFVRPLGAHTNWVRGLAFRPQDGALISAGADGMAYLWTDLSSGKRSALNQPTSLIESMALSPDGRTLATGNREGQVVLWDTSATGARGVDRPVLSGPEGAVTGIAFEPTGAFIVTSDSKGTLRLWGTGSARDAWGVLGRVDSLSAVAAVSDTQVFSVGSDGPARWTLNEDDWQRIACHVARRNLDELETRQYGFASTPKTCPEIP